MEQNSKWENQNPVWTAGSNDRRRTNSDGTVNVHCPRCGAFITAVGQTGRFGSAICIVCQKVDEGEIIPQEITDNLRQVRLHGGIQVPESSLKVYQGEDPLGGRRQEPGDHAKKHWLKAIVRRLVAKREVVEEEPKSKQIARLKRPKRVLSGGLLVNLKVNNEDENKE